MYSLNGIPMHNPAAGYSLLDSSDWAAGTSISRPSLTVPGRDGSVAMPDGVEDTPAISLLVGGCRSVLTRLRAILTVSNLSLTREGTPGAAQAELASVAFEKIGTGMDPHMEATIVLNLPGVYFRSPAETAGEDLLANSSETRPYSSTAVTGFDGITGRISDAVIRFTGCTDPKATALDNPLSFIGFKGTIAQGEWLRLHADTGRGWKTGTDTWTGGTEVDPLSIITGTGQGFLTLSPHIGTDPMTSTTGILATYTAPTPGARAEIRARNAHAV